MIIASDYDLTFDRLPSEDKDSVDFIITGNQFTEYQRMYDDGVKIPIFFNPGKTELMDIVMHKAEILSKTKAGIFYEDQKIQANLLKVMVPSCKIILIGGQK